MSNPRDFYDALAEDYHRMFADWDAAIAYQATVFGALIGAGGHTVVDCTCGIGTQALGLASLGHRVTATDVSPAAVARADREARARGLALTTAVADMRSLPLAAARFDAVVCADNSLCHLLTEPDVVTALTQMRRVLRPGGRLILSVRDYAEARRDHPVSTPLQTSTVDGRRSVTFQLWHWRADGCRYDFEHFQVHDTGAGWRTEHRASVVWALTRAEITAFAWRAGFSKLTWYAGEEVGFYQPVLVAE